jgi:hypothetical protein
MRFFVLMLKCLVLIVFAGIALGWGACGTLGLFVSNMGGHIDGGVVLLSLGGFLLMALFVWATVKLQQAFFPRERRANCNEDSSGRFEA